MQEGGKINKPDTQKNEPKCVFLAFNLELTKKGNCEKFASKVLLENKYSMTSFMVAECVLAEYYNMHNVQEKH